MGHFTLKRTARVAVKAVDDDDGNVEDIDDDENGQRSLAFKSMLRDIIVVDVGGYGAADGLCSADRDGDFESESRQIGRCGMPGEFTAQAALRMFLGSEFRLAESDDVSKVGDFGDGGGGDGFGLRLADGGGGGCRFDVREIVPGETAHAVENHFGHVALFRNQEDTDPHRV